MQFSLHYYADLTNIIRAGFDPSAGALGTPTFPMWGYGWLMLIPSPFTFLTTR